MDTSFLLKEFGKILGIELEFDESRQCLLNICDTLWVSINNKDDSYVLHGMLGDFPEQEDSDFWKRILSINKELLDLEEGTICLEDSTDSLLLIKSIPINGLDAFSFKERFEKFASTLERLIDFLAEGIDPRTP